MGRVTASAITRRRLRDSFSLFQNTVIKPFQRTLLDGLQPLFATNGIDLDFYFKTLKPADFIDVDAVQAQTTDEQEKEGVEAVPGVDGIEPAIVDSEIAESAAEADASYNGAQISAALDILVKVKEGILTARQAVLFLVQFLQFQEADAKALFDGQVSLFSLASDELQEAVADILVDMGEDEDEEYELIDEREVDYELESQLDAMWTFARVPSSNPAGKSEQDGIIKVRYRYAPQTSGSDSRDFCKKMVNAGKVYRKEDILGASNRAVNPGWGPGGANTYNLWLYKGGRIVPPLLATAHLPQEEQQEGVRERGKEDYSRRWTYGKAPPHQRPQGGPAPTRYGQSWIP